MLGQNKSKGTQQVKQTIQHMEVKQVLTKEGILKMLRQDKTIPKNRTVQNIFYQQVRGDCTNTYQLPDDNRRKQFWSKIRELN